MWYDEDVFWVGWKKRQVESQDAGERKCRSEVRLIKISRKEMAPRLGGANARQGRGGMGEKRLK